eukprot:COSAG02_NODE_23448_length_718_cov_1.452342_1_plen_33_part_10
MRWRPMRSAAAAAQVLFNASGAEKRLFFKSGLS